ncbi:MAG: 2-amino-4-hydroxy-6-hydroxymethyldihydropteridine diphosphokinase [Nitrospira sp.]|nr:2-amino-4-hydroxy-6-hydroxymethyldihydropteridine diphosphokinase [Nitrospira sp.]
MKETVYVGLGSNVGDRVDYCQRATTLLGLLPRSRVTDTSSLYETEPVNDGTDPGEEWFLNAVVALETEIPPWNFLTFLREIERALGRDPDKRSGPRTIDLDLLFYGNRLINDPQLVVPHPRVHQRRFVLVPMSELAPGWVHPATGLSVAQMLEQVTDRSVVRPFCAPPLSVGLRMGCPSR